jgi:hypothetical protein
LRLRNENLDLILNFAKWLSPAFRLGRSFYSFFIHLFIAKIQTFLLPLLPQKVVQYFFCVTHQHIALLKSKQFESSIKPIMSASAFITDKVRIQKMANLSKKPKINPLSRQPKKPRLVMAVRGGAGVGKSYFVQSMSQGDLGRLCVFDTERKSRLLKGVGQSFDGIEIEHPDELPEFIEWALNGEGKEQNYGCFALDSWAGYFGAKHSEMIKAVRERTGNPLAQPSAEELAADQMVLQEVLRKLCIESGKSVVIVDQIPAKGKEAKEDNEIGRVLPMTASGLEYFVDIMVEVSLQERGGEILRVFQVVKSNSPVFEVGFELTGDVTFQDFLSRLQKETGKDLIISENKAASVSATLPEPLEWNEEDLPKDITVEELIAKAVASGFKQSDLVNAARVYHNQPNIHRLTAEQREDLDHRMSEKVQKREILRAQN